MDPVRLQLLLTVTLQQEGMSLDLATDIYLQALRQLHERWPLAGVSLMLGDAIHVLGVGRN